MFEVVSCYFPVDFTPVSTCYRFFMLNCSVTYCSYKMIYHWIKNIERQTDLIICNSKLFGIWLWCQQFYFFSRNLNLIKILWNLGVQIICVQFWKITGVCIYSDFAWKEIRLWIFFRFFTKCRDFFIWTSLQLKAFLYQQCTDSALQN